MSLTTASPTSVDRPDITKSQAKPKLSFKEVRDSLFKFLMQADVPFSEAERVPLKTILTRKEKVDKPINYIDDDGKIRRTSIVTKEIPLDNHVFYKITCKLKDLTVNNLPVYIVTVPVKFEDLYQGQKNKLKTLREQHNIIIFDEYDWKKLKLDISDKNWLSPLTKGVMKSWSRMLFKKIAQLGGNIESKYTLNDLFTSIDKNTQPQKSNQSIEQVHSLQIQRLKVKLIEQDLKYKQSITLKDTHCSILSEFVSLDSGSLEWIEETLSWIIKDCIKKVDLRRTVYKDKFRKTNGDISVTNPEAFASIVYDFITKTKKKKLIAQNLGYGILLIQDKTTFQTIYLSLFPTNSKKVKSVGLRGSITKSNSLVFGLDIYFSKCKSTSTSIDGFIMLTQTCNKGYNYSNNYRMPIPINKNNKCNLWSKI